MLHEDDSAIQKCVGCEFGERIVLNGSSRGASRLSNSTWLISNAFRLLVFSTLSLCFSSGLVYSCVDIKKYGSLDEAHIRKLLERLIFTQPLCFAEDASSENCGPVSNRRIADFVVALVGDDALSEVALSTVMNQLSIAMNQIFEDTGVRGSQQKTPEQKGVQQIVFFDYSILLNNPDLYYQELVSKLGFGNSEYIQTAFSKFADSKSDGCLSFNVLSPTGEIKVSSTWIKNNLESVDMRQCLIKSTVGVMGIFSDGMIFEHDETGNALISIPEDYRIALKLRYNVELFAAASGVIYKNDFEKTDLEFCP